MVETGFLVGRGRERQQAVAGHQIDFIEDQDFRLADFPELFQDRLRLRVDAASCIDQQADHIRIRRTAPGGGDHRPVEPPARLEDARRIDEDDLRLPGHGDAAHQCAGGLHLARDDRDLGADKLVQECRLAGIRRADQGDETSAGGGVRHAPLPFSDRAKPELSPPHPVRRRACWCRCRARGSPRRR